MYYINMIKYVSQFTIYKKKKRFISTKKSEQKKPQNLFHMFSNSVFYNIYPSKKRDQIFDVDLDVHVCVD